MTCTLFAHRHERGNTFPQIDDETLEVTRVCDEPGHDPVFRMEVQEVGQIKEQRRLERGIRQWKTAEALAITDDRQRQAAAKVREWQARLREHVEANDLKRLRYREQITSAR